MALAKEAPQSGATLELMTIECARQHQPLAPRARLSRRPSHFPIQ